MSQRAVTIEAPGGSHAGLRVAFLRSAEGFAHSVSLMGGNIPAPLLHACEPPSPLAGPVAQEVYRHDSPAGGAAALLTGMADGRYWSASVEARGGPPASLAFDWACRLRARPSRLAAAYTLAEGVTAEHTRQGIVLLRGDQRCASVRPAPIAGRPACQASLDGRVVMLASAEVDRVDPRWGYVVVAAD